MTTATFDRGRITARMPAGVQQTLETAASMACKRGYSRSRVGSPRFAPFNDPARYVYAVIDAALVWASISQIILDTKSSFVTPSSCGDKMTPTNYNVVSVLSSALPI